MAQPLTTDAISLEQLSINTIRTLSMDAVQAANSGHPGTPMALAPVAYVLWTRHLRHDPSAPNWPDRDRFVLSCGHASMLIYTLLYLSGYDLSLEDIKAFRQLGSKTPGHPEYRVTPGVETTTGPLGQGVGNAVGMAVAEAHLAATFNRPGHDVIDHRTYFFASDGDLMEGVSHEAASLAGHLGLGKLIGVYDDNRITIDGSTDLAYSDDPVQRFAAYGWHVVHVDDGNDLDALDQSFVDAKSETDRPTLIVLRTHIGYGSPNKQDTAAAHGTALGEDEVRLTKQNLSWPSEDVFYVPEQALSHWRQCVDRGKAMRGDWSARWDRFRSAFPEDAGELERRWAGKLPTEWKAAVPTFGEEATATRGASGKVLNAIAGVIPELLGGSADLAGSVKTEMKGLPALSRSEPAGRNMYFGVREHGMGSVMNGMALHGGVRPYGGTFLIFSDYMRPAIRLAAMMQLPTIYLFSHDSIGLGEDGPTHQPIETLAALRAIPGLIVIRPADARETAEAWRVALTAIGPVAIILTRQNVPVLTTGGDVRMGAYVLSDPKDGPPEAVIMACGSELSIAVTAQRRLEEEGRRIRVINMPSMELFAQQDDQYRESVLPADLEVRVAVEAAHPMSWYRWVGLRGGVVGLNRFGESGPYQHVYQSLGITADAVVKEVQSRL